MTSEERADHGPQQNVSTTDVLAEEQRLWEWKWEEKSVGPWPL